MRYLILAILLLLSAAVSATEDPESRIVDQIIGSTDSELYIYQYVFKFDGSNPVVREKYLLIKEIVNNKLTLKKQILLISDQDLLSYVSNIPDFNLQIPEPIQSRYLQLYSSSNYKIYYLGNEYFVYDLLPKELWVYKIDKIESMYRWNEHVFIILDLESKSGIELLRKVVMLK